MILVVIVIMIMIVIVVIMIMIIIRDGLHEQSFLARDQLIHQRPLAGTGGGGRVRFFGTTHTHTRTRTRTRTRNRHAQRRARAMTSPRALLLHPLHRQLGHRVRARRPHDAQNVRLHVALLPHRLRHLGVDLVLRKHKPHDMHRVSRQRPELFHGPEQSLPHILQHQPAVTHTIRSSTSAAIATATAVTPQRTRNRVGE